MTTTMQASVWHGPHQVRLESVPRPAAGPGQVLIQVAYAGICGTDQMIYQGLHPRARAPLIMSHEFVGTVVTSDDPQFQAGQPVAINPLLSCGACSACRRGLAFICEHLGLVGIDTDGGLAQFCSVPQHTVRPLPPGLPLVEAALIEPLAVAVHAVHASDLRVGDLTAVLGAGPVGILTAQMARLAGARRVLVSEVSPKRLEIAQALGLETVDATKDDPIRAIMEMTAGEGVPVVFETAGVQTTLDQATRAARVQGQILQVGMPKRVPQIDITGLQFREISRKPIRVYREADFDLAGALAADHTLNLTLPVTHVLPLAEVERGILLAHEASEACKVLISPEQV
ncbi:MAG: zinc-dependent alcohol dehydrogenase [Anaerolineae bacterium]|jgi:(R,R)-butanediol dehydrogenase/meso-butanediol dehydrogenase/diacetyl reductase|nr:alcohol dehydrogenase catalytic domain-containing protein [Chloroflexota bacterium]